MDTCTAVLMAITDLDPTAFTDLSKIREDTAAIESRQGSMSEAGIRKYAGQYIAAARKYGFSFGTGSVSAGIIDWTYDYSAKPTAAPFPSYEGERALIHHNMAIKVPSGMKWSNRKSVIGQERCLVFLSPESEDYRNPAAAEQYFEILNPFQIAQREVLDLSDPDNKSAVDDLVRKKFASLSINPTGFSGEDGIPAMALSFKEPRELKADEKWVITYTSCQGENAPRMIFAIANEAYFYLGKFWSKSEPDPAETEKMLSAWLSSLEYCTEEEQNIEPGPWFTPQYTGGHKVSVDDLKIPVPDNMISNIDAGVDMSDMFCFVAVPSVFEDGLANYKFASIGIGLPNRMKIRGLDSLWDSLSPEEAAGRIHAFLENNGIENAQDTEVRKGFMKCFALYAENDYSDAYYCVYSYNVFVGEYMYNGTFYFNIRRSHSEYEKIIRDWLARLELS